MTGPQWTAAVVLVTLAPTLTAFFYRGVRRYGAKRKNAFLAATMAALMGASGAAMVAGSLHAGTLALSGQAPDVD